MHATCKFFFTFFATFFKSVTFFHVSVALSNKVQTWPTFQHIWNLVSQAVLNYLGKCTHSAWKYAHYFWLLFVRFLTFWSFSLLKIKKNEAMLQLYIDVTQLFCSMHFFPFQYGSPPKWQKYFKKWPKYYFFTTGGQNMQVRNKSLEIK